MDKLEFENFEVNAVDQLNDDQADVNDNDEQAIKFSSSVIAALDQKTEEHNSNFKSKVTTPQLKKVYRRGAESKHEGVSKGLCAMARVNMFLRMKQEGKVVYSEPEVDEVQSELKELVFENKAKVKVSSFIDITEDWIPIEDDFIKASQDIEVHSLDYDFKNINDLYLDDYKNLNIIWG